MAGCLRTAWSARLVVLLLLALPAVVQAQYTYTTNDGTIAITRYTGPDGVVTIPSTMDGLPVTIIGAHAFAGCTNLASVTIPNSVANIGFGAFQDCTSLSSVTIGNSVTSIGDWVFYGCYSLTSVTIPNSVTSIRSYAFYGCTSLTSVTIPNSVTSIGGYAFQYCVSLTSVTIPNSVANIGFGAFQDCTSLSSVTIPSSVTRIETSAFNYCYGLTGIYFKGNAPSFGLDVFIYDNNATVYYLPGTTGWKTTFAYRPAKLWNPQPLTSDSTFGVQTNRFGFNITGTSELVIVVEACTDLGNPIWFPLGTNTLTGGSSYFSDPQWTNFPARFYRLRSP